jgi:hypothetical protein
MFTKDNISISKEKSLFLKWLDLNVVDAFFFSAG